MEAGGRKQEAGSRRQEAVDGSTGRTARVSKRTLDVSLLVIVVEGDL
ncbi:MAG TPA: hypothetical protein VGK99_16250 [Acidobacteriota bacterium]|jgi:hypothetical protein